MLNRVVCSLGLKECPFNISKHAIEHSYTLLFSLKFEIAMLPSALKNNWSFFIKNNARMLFLLIWDSISGRTI